MEKSGINFPYITKLAYKGSIIKSIIFLFLFFLGFSSIYTQETSFFDWIQIYDGPSNGIDMVNDMKMKKEIINIVGRSSGDDGSQDLCILQYSISGDSLNTVRYLSGKNAWDEGNSIAIDLNLDFYVTGSATFDKNSFYAIFQKYSKDGELIWHKDLYNSKEIHSEGQKVVVDLYGDPIFGYICYEENSVVYFKKYSNDGDSLWNIKVFSDSTDYYLTSMTVDSLNNLTASVLRTFYCNSDVPCQEVEILKINQFGEILLQKDFHQARDAIVRIDQNMNIILMTNFDSNEIKIIKLSSTGNIIWENDFSNSHFIVLRDFMIDHHNDIVVTGYGIETSGFDYITQKISSTGKKQWEKVFSSEENLNDFASTLTIDKDDNIYVTGNSHNYISKGVCYTIKYDSQGAFIWKIKFDAVNSIFENAKSIAIDDSNNIIIAGNVSGITNGWNYFVLRINQKLDTDLTIPKNNLPSEYRLDQNFPNPFNPITKITYSIPYSGLVKIEILNTLGQKIKEIENRFLLPGNYNVVFNANGLSSGVYFYKISVNNYTSIKKAIFIK